MWAGKKSDFANEHCGQDGYPIGVVLRVNSLQQPLNGTIVYFEPGRILRSKDPLSHADADGPKLALRQHHLPPRTGSATSADHPFSFVQNRCRDDMAIPVS